MQSRLRLQKKKTKMPEKGFEFQKYNFVYVKSFFSSPFQFQGFFVYFKEKAIHIYVY